jgi:hypothetical protein
MDYKSNTICVMPWIHLFIGTHGWTQTCCVSGTGEENIPVLEYALDVDSIEDLLLCNKLKIVRKKMIDGEWPEECSVCKNKEKTGIPSFRNAYNKEYSEYYDAIRNGLLKKPLIRILDIRFSNRCNYKCRTCSGWNSSCWFTDHNLLYKSIPIGDCLINHFDDISFKNKVYKVIQCGLEEVHFAGGEPLISDEHYEILELLVNSNLLSTKLYYDTNLCTLKHKQWDILLLWSKFRNIHLSLSIDGIGKKGEYIRHGLDYKNWKKNVFLIKSKKKEIDFYVHFVVSIFNIYDIVYHVKKIVSLNIVSLEHISFTYLEWPSYLCIQSLPYSFKKKVEKKIKRHISTCKNAYFNNVLQQMLVFMFDKNTYNLIYETTRRNLSLLDISRNESYERTFPYLKKIYSTKYYFNTKNNF